MTLQRRVYPGQVHLVTRRVVGRTFLLRPSKAVNDVVLYALARASSETGVVVLNWLSESNHYHGVLHDPKGKLSDFEQRLDSLVARALNCYYGRGQSFWEPVKYSNVELHDPETILEKMLYVLVNVVQDGLVASPDAWPGCKVVPEEAGTTIVVEKPDGAFFGGRRRDDYEPGYKKARDAFRAARAAQAERDAQLERKLQRQGKALSQQSDLRRRYRDRRTLPAAIPLRIGVPPGFEHLGAKRFGKLLRDRLTKRLLEVQIRRDQQGLRGYMGAERVLREDPFGTAGDVRPTFKLDPRLACSSPEARIPLLLGLKAWRVKYRDALKLWTSSEPGAREAARFPYGTIQRKVLGKIPLQQRPRKLHAQLGRAKAKTKANASGPAPPSG